PDCDHRHHMVEPEQRMREATDKAAGCASVHDVGNSRPAGEQQRGDERYPQGTGDVAMLGVSHTNHSGDIHDEDHDDKDRDVAPARSQTGSVCTRSWWPRGDNVAARAGAEPAHGHHPSPELRPECLHAVRSWYQDQERENTLACWHDSAAGL